MKVDCSESFEIPVLMCSDCANKSSLPFPQNNFNFIFTTIYKLCKTLRAEALVVKLWNASIDFSQIFNNFCVNNKQKQNFIFWQTSHEKYNQIIYFEFNICVKKVMNLIKTQFYSLLLDIIIWINR